MSDDDESRGLGPESDDEGEDSDDDDIDITRRKKEAFADMKTMFNSQATEDTIEQFLNQHRAVVEHVGSDGVTFFHKIVQLVNEKDNENSLTASSIKPLFERLVKEYPEKLQYRDQEGQTALYRAVKLKRYTWKLVDYILNSFDDPMCIEDALSTTCGKGESSRTCLTLAFEKNLNAGVLRNLVSQASETVLELPDGSHRTPFHYAVEYKQCTDERVQIIQLLLDKDAEMVRNNPSGTFQPVETFLDRRYRKRGEGKQDEVEYSVYGEHERTANAYLKTLQDGRDTKARNAERDRTDVRAAAAAAGTNLRITDREPPKPEQFFPKKIPTGGEHDRAGRHQSEQGSASVLLSSDENERQRHELKQKEKDRREKVRREKEDQELQEKRSREEKKRKERAPELDGDHNHLIKVKDQKERLYESCTSGSDLLRTIQASNANGADHAPNTPVKRVVTQSFDGTDAKKEKEKAATASSKKGPKKTNPEVLAKNSAQILQMLKLHYMRTRNIKMATSFLYGKNIQKDIHICFDYEGLPSEIQDHVFMERFGKDDKSGIRFDEVLMYVRFPIVAVKRTDRRAPKPRALGRQDMEFFFEWLYNKGVRRILKLEVDDSGNIPHSDEAIQTSLEKIVVEHLDWRKTDLDPRIVCHKGNTTSGDKTSSETLRVDLREVTLQWSGNNAVLRSWSEVDGLPKLPKLEVVHLDVPAQSNLYDTRDWVLMNIVDFGARLDANANDARNNNSRLSDNTSRGSEKFPTEQMVSTADCKKPPTKRKITVFSRDGKKGTNVLPVSSGGVPQPARSNPVTEHDWLNCTERFGGCMDLFWKRTVELSRVQVGNDSKEANSRPSKGEDGVSDALQQLGKDVVVALIDDGVDCCDAAFSGRVIEGKTFDYRDGSVGQYYISAKGHGTEMARMILRVCPMASIYSIRLKTHSSPDKGPSTIDAVSAALAIEAALEKNATIISMSWTLPVPPEGSEEKRLLDSILERACSRNVLMFCSSPDQISASPHYPSAFRRSRFFLIGAAHDDGSAYGHAGKDNDFIFPGVNVNTSGGSSLPAYLADKTSSSKESTGSSIATALAAGLAAMITYCFKARALGDIVVKMRQQCEDHVAGPNLASVYQGDVDRISQHTVLKTAFNRLGKIDNGQFIEVWKRFQPASEILEVGDNYDEKLSCITKLCSNLIEH
ncbi:intracellular serine protease [Colletotrichum higginsianum]|nr:intracellular serine protease [Colletotrichum higginsianum]